jgi:ABC-type phosphate transport system ATPase subunit
MVDDLKFKHPFTCIVGGPSGSGKTSFTLRLLHNLATLSTELHFSGGILWCYSEKSDVPSREVAALRKSVHFTRVYLKIWATSRAKRAPLFLTTY